MNKLILIIMSLVCAIPSVKAQSIGSQALHPVSWQYRVEETENDTYKLHITATIQPGWHLYSQHQPEESIAIPTKITFKADSASVILEGQPQETGQVEKFENKTLGISALQYEHSVDFAQAVKLKTETPVIISGSITYQACLKEAYNLMQGRAVNKDLISKEGQVYNAWLQLDFKQTDKQGNYKLHPYHEKYEYDLESALSKHPIMELENEQYKSNLMNSLKKGNLQSVTLQINGNDQKRYIEANPKFKTINIYDSSMQRVNSRQSKKEDQSVSESQTVKQSGKKEQQTPVEEDGPETPKKSKKRKKTPSMS